MPLATYLIQQLDSQPHGTTSKVFSLAPGARTRPDVCGSPAASTGDVRRSASRDKNWLHRRLGVIRLAITAPVAAPGAPIPVAEFARTATAVTDAGPAHFARSGGRIVRCADLDVAAVAQRRDGRDRQLILWYRLGTVDEFGTGRLLENQISDAVRYLRLSSRTRQRTLRGGMGTFWARGRGGLYLRSPARIAAALKVPAFRAAFWAPLAGLRGPIATVRARLATHGIAAIRRGLPTSVAVMAEMLNASPRTVRYWLRRSGVRSRENFAVVAPLSPTSSVGEIFRTTKEPGLRAVKFDGRPWLVLQLPNSLPALKRGGVRSHLRRANRRLRSLVTGPASSDSRGGGTVGPRYRTGARNAPAATAPSTTACFAHSPAYAFVKISQVRGEPVRLWSPTIS